MGTMIDIYCKDCNNKKSKAGIDENITNSSLFLGIGMMFSPENVFFENTPWNEKPIIFDEVSEKNILQDIKRLLQEGAFIIVNIAKVMKLNFIFR